MQPENQSQNNNFNQNGYAQQPGPAPMPGPMYAPAQPMMQQTATAESNGLAIAALVTGLLGMGLVAVILGILGLKKPGGRGMSIAGIVLGSIQIVLIILFFFLMMIGALASGDLSSTTSNY